jgi:hypothetical protein
MKQTNIAKANGTSLQGYIRATYSHLVRCFGEPIQTNCGKTNIEWVLESDNGEIVTIYDWKVSRQAWDNDQLFQFNVGGKSNKVLDTLENFFKEKEKAWHPVCHTV